MTNKTRSLQEVVGDSTYTVWTEMLRRLVPGGRTHRIAAVVAAMLQHAVMVAAEEQREGDLEENTVGQSLLAASELYDIFEVRSEIGDVTEQLFEDAGVSFKRTNAKGEHYSILEQIWHDFLSWYNMPWES